MRAIHAHERGVTISLYVQPRASTTEIAGRHGNSLRLRVAAPPVDGAANAEVVTWLSKLLRVPKRDIVILNGERGRRKTVLAEGVTLRQIQSALGLA